MRIQPSNDIQKIAGWRLRPGEARTILLLGDLFIACVALTLALYAWALFDNWFEFSLAFLQDRVQFWFYLLPFAWLVMMVELYDSHRASNWRITLRGIAIAVLTGMGIYAFIYLLSPPDSLPRVGVGIFLTCAAVLTLVWRSIYIRVFTAPAFMRRVLIIGAGVTGSNLVRSCRKLRPAPFHLVGFIDDDPAKIGKRIEDYPVLAGSDQLLAIIDKENVSDLVIAISGEMHGETFQAILDAQERGVEITTMPMMYEEMLGRVPVRYLESDWVIRSFVDEARVSRFYEFGKRLLDILGGATGILIFVILLPFTAMLILLDSGGPILYAQTRSGKRGKVYHMRKFRTMHKDAEKNGKARMTQERDERITRVGKFLRRTHIDELPQFWNVLRGEMSLVGPRSERPELVADFHRQIPFYRARLLVKPGITGWAQVNYGYVSTLEGTITKLEYDLYYIKHRSLMMDIVIILRTIGQVIGLRGR